MNVSLHNIVNEEEAYRDIRELVDRVARTKETVLITRAGHPTVALVDADTLDTAAPSTGMPAATMQPAFVAPLAPVQLPDMPSSMGAPMTPPAAPVEAPYTPPFVAVNDSPMNETVDAPASIMSAPMAAPVAPTAPATEATPMPNMPVMPMPIQTTFGQDIPESSDPMNGSPLA